MRRGKRCKGSERLAVSQILVDIADQFLRIDIAVVPGLAVGVGCRLTILGIGFCARLIMPEMISGSAAQQCKGSLKTPLVR